MRFTAKTPFYDNLSLAKTEIVKPPLELVVILSSKTAVSPFIELVRRFLSTASRFYYPDYAQNPRHYLSLPIDVLDLTSYYLLSFERCAVSLWGMLSIYLIYLTCLIPRSGCHICHYILSVVARFTYPTYPSLISILLS